MSSLSFSARLGREVRLLFTDPWICSLITWIPLLLSLLLWSVFAQGLARELPIGVVDFDKSQVARSILRHYDASPALKMEKSYPDVHQGSADLRAGRIYALVVIPEDLEKTPPLALLLRSPSLLTASFS